MKVQYIYDTHPNIVDAFLDSIFNDGSSCPFLQEDSRILRSSERCHLENFRAEKSGIGIEKINVSDNS